MKDKIKKTLAIDIGLKRIGVALSLDENIVTPLNAIIRKNRNQASNDVKKLILEWSIERLVVGIPMEGSTSEEMKRRIEHFVRLIDFDGEISYQDESFTSYEASELMAGVTKNRKDGKSDSIAAMLILERFLNS